ncbi:hypothetical protein ACJ72_02003 [Emergomyces africanus]|uniref:Uncharacterized protein n=1 Tax=Emergomyces africanus TaxID=1955775 RepID=A0A1B7P3N6_9EURO|nr:hypothetical protein ACJ72_02003 [Emergomyces africanus]
MSAFDTSERLELRERGKLPLAEARRVFRGGTGINIDVNELDVDGDVKMAVTLNRRDNNTSTLERALDEILQEQ